MPLLFALAWAVIEAIGGRLGGYSPYQVVWTRYAVHLLVLLAIVRARGGPNPARTGRPVLQVARALLMLGMPACYILGIRRMGADATLAVFWVAPLVAMALAAALLGERAGWRRWAVALAALAGVLLTFAPVGDVVRRAAVLPLGMALCFALYLVLTRLLCAERTETRLFYTALGVLVPLTLIQPLVWRTPTPAGLAGMAAIGVLGLGALYTLDRALDRAPAGSVAIFTFSQPVWVLAVAALGGGHLPAPRALLGALVILGALAATDWAAAGLQPADGKRSLARLW